MPRGGARIGAGRPKKPLNEKLLDGNPGKREITILQTVPNSSQTQPFYDEESNNPGDNSKNSRNKLPSYLDLASKEGGDSLPPAKEICELLMEFVESTGCTEFIAPILYHNFALLFRGFLECEYMNRKLGRIASGKRSPYVIMAMDYQQKMMAVYNQIWLVISRNCETQYQGKNDFLEMLTNRGI